MKNLIILIILIGTVSLSAQRNKVIYAEGLGSGILYSVNYDMRFRKAINGPGFRVGAGAAGASNDFSVFSPIQLNWVFGGKHALEIGAGALSIYNIDRFENKFYIYPGGALVYRYTGDRGLSFRAGITPVFIEDTAPLSFHELFWIWPGVSIGYAF